MSQKVPIAKLKLNLAKKPVPTAQIFCPSNTFLLEGALDPRISSSDVIEKTIRHNGIANMPAVSQFKDLMQYVSESAVEVNMISELNGSELSLLNMLEEDNVKKFEENSNYSETTDMSIERKLREEVVQLRKDLIMKSSLIEKLIKENDSLRKEMDEVLSTVQDAKDKINVKLNEGYHRIKELEGEVKTLTEENKQYQDQLQKATAANKEAAQKASLKKLDEHIGKYYTDTQEKMEVFYQKLNEQFTSMSPRIQYTLEEFQKDIKEQAGKVRSRHASPNSNVRAHISPQKTRNISQSRNVRQLKAANNSPVCPERAERAGAINNTNRRNKTIALHHTHDMAIMNKSENNCVRTYNANEACVISRSPKAGFGPVTKIRIAGPGEGIEYGQTGI